VREKDGNSLRFLFQEDVEASLKDARAWRWYCFSLARENLSGLGSSLGMGVGVVMLRRTVCNFEGWKKIPDIECAGVHGKFLFPKSS
jgi:hypothetical protein